MVKSKLEPELENDENQKVDSDEEEPEEDYRITQLYNSADKLTPMNFAVSCDQLSLCQWQH